MNGMRINKNILEINTHINNVEFFDGQDGIVIKVTARTDTADDIINLIKRANTEPDEPSEELEAGLNLREFLEKNNF